MARALQHTHASAWLRAGLATASLALLLTCLAAVVPGSARAAASDLDPSFDGDGVVDVPTGTWDDLSVPLMSLDYANRPVTLFHGMVDDRRWTYAYRDTTAGMADTGYSGDGMFNFEFEPTVGAAYGDHTEWVSISDAQQHNDGLIIFSMANGSFQAKIRRIDSSGQLDPTFATSGVFSSASYLRYIAVGSGGGEIFASYMTSASGDETIHVIKLNANGTQDMSWAGTGELAWTSPGAADQFKRMAVDPAGHLVVTGTDGAAGFVARFTTTGSGLDTTFDTDGIVNLPSGTPDAVFTDGSSRVYVDASTGQLYRFTAAGAPDTGWGGGSGWIAFSGLSNATYVRSDGEVVGATTTTILRYSSSGTPVAAFGGGSVTAPDLSTGLPSHYNRLNRVALDPTGRVYATMISSTAIGSKVVTMRFTTAGVLDTAFAGVGYRTYIPTGGGSRPNSGGSAIAVRGGYIYWAAQQFVANNSRVRLYRFNEATGARDTTWNGTGTTEIPVTAPGTYSNVDLLFDGSGRMLVAFSQGSSACAVARITAAGSLDGTFGSGGIVSFAGTCNGIEDLELVGTNVAVAQVHSSASTTIRMLDSTGAPVLAFDGDGSLPLPVQVRDMTTDGFGHLILAGYAAGDGYVTAVDQVTGAVDSGFGTAGETRFRIGAASTTVESVVVDASGRYVMGIDSNDDAGAARLDSSGLLDASFGTGGVNAPGMSSPGVVGSNVYDDPIGQVRVTSFGAIRIGGQYMHSMTSPQQRWSSWGFSPDGQLDPGWGGDGVASPFLAPENDADMYWNQDAYIYGSSGLTVGGLASYFTFYRAYERILRFQSDSPPATPTLVSPAASATVGSSGITFTASYSDPDGSPGSIDIQVCTTATCTTVVGSGSASGITSGSNGTVTVSNTSPGARYWRARATDFGGSQSAWSAARAVTIVQDKVWPSLGRTFITKGDGTLWVAADGSGGQFGNGMTGASQFDYEPVQVEKSPGVPFTNAIQVVERGSVYVLTSDGFVWKHGFGSGPYARVEASAGVPFANAVQIDTSYPSALIIRRSDGTVWVLGPYPGDGTTSTPPYPVQVQLSPGVPLTNAIDVTAGDAGNVWGAVTSGGTAYTWGNSSIMLAQGPQTSAVYAEPIETSAGVNATGIVQMVLGGEKAYARRSGGTLYGWGWAWTTYATSITGPTAATDIAVRKSGGYAVDASGNLWSGSSGIWTQVAGVTNAVSVKSAKDAGNVTYYGWNVGIVRSTGAVAMSSENQTGQGIQCNSIPIPSGTFLDIKWSCPAANVGPRVAGTMHKYDPTDTEFSYYYANHGVSDDLGLSFDVADPDANQTLTPYVKLKPGSWVPSTDTCGPGAGITQLPDVNTTTPLTYVETAHHVVTGLTDGSDYYFGMCLIDQDGVATGWTSKTVAIDVSPPTAPVAVLDGAIPPDIDIQTGLTQLQLNGTGSTDSVSYVNGYQSCVTTSSTGADCGGTPVQGWTNLASFPAADAINVALTPYTTYYVCVRAIDAATNVGPHTCSDGVYVDAPVTVDSAAPSSAAQGRRGLVVQLDGSGFVSGATATISGTGITITNTSWVSATRIDLTVDITGSATLGARNITITNPDLSSGTGTGIFTVTAPSITLALTTLGYSDAARDTVAPYTANLGVLTPGSTRSIGPAASGQTLPGAAFRINLTTDTTTQLDVTATQMTDGTNTMPFASTEFKPSASGTWTPLAATPTTATTDIPPGTPTLDYDYRLTVPALQIAGTYTQNLTWTAIAKP